MANVRFAPCFDAASLGSFIWPKISRGSAAGAGAAPPTRTQCKTGVPQAHNLMAAHSP